MLIPVLRICVTFFRCVLFPAGLTQAKCVLVIKLRNVQFFLPAIRTPLHIYLIRLSQSQGYIMPFHMYILNFLQCNVFAQKKLVAMTFEVTHVCLLNEKRV
jgi:hypothetical protein